MADIIEIRIGDQTVYFETAFDGEYQIDKVGVQELGQHVAISFQKALDTIRLVAGETIHHVREFDKEIAPDEFQIQFGIKLGGEYGAVVAKANGEAQLSVTLTYKHQPEPANKDC